MNKEEIESIEIQRQQVFGNHCAFNLKSSCSINNGILSIERIQSTLDAFQSEIDTPVFFIPASGSGSRMFDFLYDFLESKEENDQVTQFFNQLSQFAFYSLIKEFDTSDSNGRLALVEYMLSKDGLAFGDLPKGLIPFHQKGNEITNPFQDQYRQMTGLLGKSGNVHFTVQEKYLNLIIDSLIQDGANIENISFSFQSSESDAFCFSDKQEVQIKAGEYLRRPSGHGALLANLNRIDADEVLIKNIDNIQPTGKHEISTEYWKISLNLLKKFKQDLNSICEDFSFDKVLKLNEQYEFIHPSKLQDFRREDLLQLCQRPTRVCGMVRNTGKPGGGPFWMEENGHITKQIVEKSQIGDDPKQVDIFNSGTHFNPVFIAISKSDVFGNRLDLNDFVDQTKFFTVEKMDEGKLIKYRELPGLWNGSMSNWNSIFIEVPEDVFTPVKTVLDLLDESHVV